ncbi:BA75_02230T0 [Komagataella pastoris]|uniref:BA75_02230T0 n=1 Tax=Komagataella pastoris TaxID=4922 RepID=A0A1B2JBY1_PICPA|nr:BA75_02230T0 [Komagataella pastoris]
MSDLTASRFREYKVMYTTDVIQKRKRWHDGTLRVFDFNNKCFLKDDILGQLVETSFVDGSIAFDEGVLVKLEGVLVEVEYLLGVYERDASSVICGSLGKHPEDVKPITKVLWESEEHQSYGDYKVVKNVTRQAEQRPRWRPVGLPHPRSKK